MLNKKFLIDNATSFLLYLSGAIISWTFALINLAPFQIWLPLAITFSTILLKSKSLLGLVVASFIAHFAFLVFDVSTSNSMLLVAFLAIGLATIEILSAIAFKNLTRKWLSPSISEGVINSPLTYYLIVITTIFPLVAFQSFISQENNLLSSLKLMPLGLMANAFTFVIISSIILKYLLVNEKKISNIKIKVSPTDKEVERQTNQYKELNRKLFEEVEKRGIAEQELAKSKKLLLDAQVYSGIATWEYSFKNDKFRWISYSNLKPIIDIDIEGETLKTLALKIHPEDLKQLNSLSKATEGEDKNFEIELRFKTRSGSYNFYLLKGSRRDEDKNDIKLIGLIMDISERKRAEIDLYEKEQKYRALFDSNIDPICVIDAESREIKDVNNAFELQYGYKLKELNGKQYHILSAQPEETNSEIAISIQKGYHRVLQRTHRKSNAEEFLVEANLMKHRVNGRDMMFIITHDITQRKRSEMALAEREQKFRTFFESDLIGMAEISISKEFLTYNNKLLEILGYTEKELSLLNWESITIEEDINTETKLFNQLLTHVKDGYRLEKRLKSKSGRIVFSEVSLRSIKNAKGNITHIIVLVEDISERKRVEIELKESQLQLIQAQSVSKIGTVRFYAGKKHVILSDEAYAMLGHVNSKPSITRKDFFRSIIPNPRSKFEEQICKLESGIMVDGEFEQSIIGYKGEVKHLLANFGISYNHDGTVSEVLVTLADITKVKEAEIALQEANTLKDQLFSIISHDLRSPIGSINQLLELYDSSRNELDKETSNSVLQTLKTTSTETYKLLENLLEWANTQRTVNFRPVETDLIDITDQVLALSKSVAKSKNITLVSELLATAPVLIDIDMIKTTLRNLISNSIKFTPSSGMVKVEIKEVMDKYQISISDTGVGIPSDVLLKLFDNTSSISTPGTNNEKGTGLGLKLVKKFVEKNGGEVQVESLPGQGSTFMFTLPKLPS